MAEQIAQDPSFRQMTSQLQSGMGGMMPNAQADEAGSRGAPPVDPANYAEAMSGVLSNPQFMEMAEKLGQQIMQVCAVSYMACMAGTPPFTTSAEHGLSACMRPFRAIFRMNEVHEPTSLIAA